MFFWIWNIICSLIFLLNVLFLVKRKILIIAFSMNFRLTYSLLVLSIIILIWAYCLKYLLSLKLVIYNNDAPLIITWSTSTGIWLVFLCNHFLTPFIIIKTLACWILYFLLKIIYYSQSFKLTWEWWWLHYFRIFILLRIFFEINFHMLWLMCRTMCCSSYYML